MDRQGILNALAATLDPNPQVRKQAESQLIELEKQPGFTVFCLEVAVDESVPLSQRSSSAVFFKNRVYTYWGKRNERGILEEEQEQIRVKLIEALVKCYNDNHIRPQLSVAVKNILNCSQWNLSEPIYHLLNNPSDPAYRYTGLLLLLEATKSLRYKYQDTDRAPLNGYVSQMFPILERCASDLIQQNDYKSGEMMYYILKIFKYATLADIPHYFHEVSNLETWVSLHLALVQKPLPNEILELDPADRVLDKRVKCQKWAFGNIQRFYQRYCTPTSKNSTPEFIDYFHKAYVPRILQAYFAIIEKWGSGSWLSDSSLYNLISFIEKCIMTEAWEMIQPHYNAILRHLIFPCLCQENLELFEDDPEEYIRRYFDINRESNTADTAAVDALFVTAHHRPEEVNGILAMLNEVFSDFTQSPSEKNALKAEGGLRTLSSVSFALTKQESPFLSQVDQIIDGFVVPLLTGQHLFLRARACETISIFAHEYTDKNVLSKVFQGVYADFKNEENMPVQIEAADALKVLINDELVINAIRGDVPHIMQKLLTLSKSFDLDMLAEIMEAFVEVFANELQPFAMDMGNSLCEQFVRTAQEMMELQNSGSDYGSADDKEYQAIGFINTMSTMTMSMTKVNLEDVFMPAVEFVVQNAALAFITEAMELAESFIVSSKTVSARSWALYNMVIDSFQTYAAEFFETYIPFFEAIILYGFKGMTSNSKEVFALKQVIHELLESPIDYDNVGTLELIEYMTLTFGEFSEDVPLVLKLFREEELSPHGVIQILLASLYVSPQRTLDLLQSMNETIRLLEIWYNLSASFETVYGLKLQILGLLSLFSLPTLPDVLLGFIPQLSLKLVTCIERLPTAIQKRVEQIKVDYYTPAEQEGEFEIEEDVFKVTPLDDLNAFLVYRTKMLAIQSSLPERYNQIMSSIPAQKIEAVEKLMKLVEGQESA